MQGAQLLNKKSIFFTLSFTTTKEATTWYLFFKKYIFERLEVDDDSIDVQRSMQSVFQSLILRLDAIFKFRGALSVYVAYTYDRRNSDTF